MTDATTEHRSPTIDGPAAAPGPFAAGRWTGRWIWSDQGPSNGRRRFTAFRHTFTLGSAPASVPARLCADSRYALWVNGTEVARGPGRANPRRLRYDTLDLAPFLAEGTNTVAVLGCFYGSATTWWMPAPTLVSPVNAGGFVFEAHLDGEVVATSAEWKARPVEGWTADPPADFVAGRGLERLDLRSLADGWEQPGFDDADWADARELAGVGLGEPGRPEPPTFPFGPTLPRATSWPATTTVELAPTAAGSFVADRLVVGTIVVDVEAPAGVEVVVTAAEFAEADGTLTEGRFQFGAVLVGDGTRRQVQTFDVYGLQAVAVDAPDGAVVHGVTVREQLHPVTGAGAFTCSDPVLDEIWAVGRRTVSICSLDAYVDCPTREQRAWTGDAVVHQMVDLATNDDWTLARWSPLLGASPRADGMLPMAIAGDAEAVDLTVIPDWSLHWLHGVWNLQRHVGDRDEVARLLGVAEGVLRWFEPFADEHGCLVDVMGWVIIDWASVHTEGVSAALNGLWGRALLEFAELADWVGDVGRARWARGLHARLVGGFERLWDPERGRYVDSLLDGERRPMASQHGQAAAIVGGLVPAERLARLVEVLTDEADLVHATFSKADGPALPGSETEVGGAYLRAARPEPWWDVERQVVRAQPFFRYVVHDALAAAGRSDLIAAQCRDWAWLLERCPSSWSETWFGGTISHGWSSTPTRDLTTRVLGVGPAEPGYAAAHIEPALGDLAWASGTVPTPAGPITVHATPTTVTVDSPVPFDHHGTRHPAGRHQLTAAPTTAPTDGGRP